MRELVRYNRDKVQNIAEKILYICGEPMCFERILQEVFKGYGDTYMSKEMDNKEEICRPPLWIYSVCGGSCFFVLAMCRLKGNNKRNLELKNKKSAIHEAKLTIHEADIRNSTDFSDNLVEGWR